MDRLKKIKFVGYIIVVITLLSQILEFIMNTMQMTDFIERQWPHLLNLNPLYLNLILIPVSIFIVYVLLKTYESRKKQVLPPVNEEKLFMGKFIDNSKFEIRYAMNKSDIIELEKTEDYGDAGCTDIEQVMDWLANYQKGNFLAIYDSKIVGGMDLWPVQKRVYDDMRAGRMGEEELRGHHITKNDSRRKASYWYLASISLGLVWRGGRFRYELLTRLLMEATAQWGSDVKAYPANVLAMGWTTAGKNLLRHFGFTKLDKLGSAYCQDEVYCRTFSSPEELEQLIEALRKRFELCVR